MLIDVLLTLLRLDGRGPRAQPDGTATRLKGAGKAPAPASAKGR